jgi:hypothetical protein
MSTRAAMRSTARRPCGKKSRANAEVIKLGKFEVNSRGYCGVVQLQGRRPAAEGRQSVGRSAQPRASCQDAEGRRQRPAARRTDQRPRRRNATARWKRRWKTSPVAPSSSAMIACSSTVWRPTSSPSKATAMWNGSKATSRTTRQDKIRRLGADALNPGSQAYKRLTR